MCEIPITINDFAKNNKEHYDLIKEAIKVHEAHKHYMITRICAVCGKDLSIWERNRIKDTDFHYTCDIHSKYSTKYNIDKIREKLGYKFEIKNYFY
jgi:hypothetical protein